MRHRVLIGCSYPGPDGPEVRREPGDVVDDLPASVEAALLEMHAIGPDNEIPVVIGGGAFDAPAYVAYHATDGKVHHTLAACPMGNNIEPASRELGTGDLKKCRDCARLERAEKE